MRRGTLIASFLFAFFGMSVASAAWAQPKSDWETRLEERDWKERDLKLPEFPKGDNLIEFEASAANPFRFFVDSQSLTAGSDGVIRYTLVARSRSGAESISYDGLRCKGSAHKVYAIARPDKTWSTMSTSEWKEIEPRTVSRQHQALMRDFFCPAGSPIATREEGIDALRRGIHPSAVSSHSNFTR